MDPSVINGKYSKEITPSRSGETFDGNPYWFEDTYAEEDLDSVIATESKYDCE